MICLPHRLCHLFAAFILTLSLNFAGSLAPAFAAEDNQSDNLVDTDANNNFSPSEILDAGHNFFGAVSTDLAKAIEHMFSKYGRPNGYILGEEGGGAIIAGARYGEGTLYTRNRGSQKVYWQGPSLGWDFGGDGGRTMILVYNLNSIDDMYRTYVGVNGSAYLVGGVGLTVLSNHNVLAAPIRSGVGLRLGVNIGYLKFTRTPTWNPF
ncbi:MAG: DUF1134 domain-containing protein [Fimbriimonadaceae bacterium]|nr:DUF1134 domain-containing protein [Alphaproteobacteria bacterium]